MGQDFDLDFCIHPRWTWIMIVHQCCLISFSLLCSWSKERKILPVQNMGDGGWGGAAWLHSLIIFSYISTGTLCGKEGDCLLSGNVFTWGWWLSETTAYLVSWSGKLFCFCTLHLSPCIGCLWGIFLKVSSAFARFILFRTAGGSHQSVNPTLNGKDVQMMQWERRKIIDLVVGRSNKNNNTKIQWES